MRVWIGHACVAPGCVRLRYVQIFVGVVSCMHISVPTPGSQNIARVPPYYGASPAPIHGPPKSSRRARDAASRGSARVSPQGARLRIDGVPVSSVMCVLCLLSLISCCLLSALSSLLCVCARLFALRPCWSGGVPAYHMVWDGRYWLTTICWAYLQLQVKFWTAAANHQRTCTCVCVTRLTWGRCRAKRYGAESTGPRTVQTTWRRLCRRSRRRRRSCGRTGRR